MTLEEKDVEAGTTPDTGDGNAGVSDRSEREIEAGPDGSGKDLADDDASDADEALEALSEADPKRATAGLRKRVAKLTAQRNKAREAASERDALAARVAAYEKREREEKARQREVERHTPEGMKAEERRAAVRAAIDEGFPGASMLLDDLAEQQQLRAEKHAQDGISYLKKELEDHGIEINDGTLVRYERAVGSELAEDSKLLAAFRRPATQQKAIELAFERVRDGLVNPVLKQSGAKTLARIERNREAVLGGGRSNGSVAGAPEPERDLTPPKDFKGNLDDYWREVKQREWERLSRSEA